jgi:hypothetical protein
MVGNLYCVLEWRDFDRETVSPREQKDRLKGTKKTLVDFIKYELARLKNWPANEFV